MILLRQRPQLLKTTTNQYVKRYLQHYSTKGRIAAATFINVKDQTNIEQVVETVQQENGIKAKSMFITATPNHSLQLLNYIRDSIEVPGSAQIIGAVVDSLAYGSQRDGISVLVFGKNNNNNKDDSGKDTDYEIEINSAVRLASEEEQERMSIGRPSVRGVVTARNPWTLSDSYLSIQIPGNNSSKQSAISIPLANTLFETGTQATLLVNRYSKIPMTGKRNTLLGGAPAEDQFIEPGTLLSALQVTLPFFTNSDSLQINSIAPLVKLTTNTDGGGGDNGKPHIITACKNNMIKTIDRKPAAGFLESCITLMAGPKKQETTGMPSSLSRKVFAAIGKSNNNNKQFSTETNKLKHLQQFKEAYGSGESDKQHQQQQQQNNNNHLISETAQTSRYEVIAGGGGSWSPRASMLVLDPHASPDIGDTITFSLSDSSMPILSNSLEYRKLLKSSSKIFNDSFINNNDNKTTTKDNNNVGIVLDCAPILESSKNNQADLFEQNTVLDGVFCAGSEQGVLVDDIKYNVPGEVLEIFKE